MFFVFIQALLFLIFCVHTDGDRPVVQQFHFHVSAELPCAHWFSKSVTKLSTEGLIERDRVLVRASTEPAWTITLLVAGIERELAHYQGLTVDVYNRAVHYIVLVAENAQIGYLFNKPFDVFRTVLVAHTKQNEKALLDGSFLVGVNTLDVHNPHAGAAHTLYDCSHSLIFRQRYKLSSKVPNNRTSFLFLYVL